MADDGIELNFAVPSAGAIRQVAPKKGGRWTDRVKAKREVRDTFRSLKSAGNTSATTSAPVPSAAPAPVFTPVSAPVVPKARPAPFAAPAPAPVSRPPPPRPTYVAPPPRPTSSNAIAGPSRPAPTPRNVSTPATSSKPRQSVDHAPRQSLPRQEVGFSAAEAAKPKAPGIISSLFTSDPLPAAPKATAPTAPVGAPSNAPLGDTSTFEGLGLDKMLIRHMANKMHVDKPTAIQRSCLPFMLSSPLDPDATIDEGTPLRDVLLQAQTGSGKTLAYLLPIVQTLLPLSRLSYIDRSIGTLAIILAPTRELAQQISKVVEQLCSMSFAQEDEDDRPFTRWLVSGLLTGGSTRTHEKARLRKGVPILVSTPGRLLDHLQNTASFQCAKTMFLVLDEADRLMDLGFEETIQGIIRALEGRRRNEINVEKEMDEEGGGAMRWGFWGRGRMNVLCSATVDAKVEKLSGAALKDPVLFRAEKEQVPDVKGKEKKKDEAVVAAMEEAQAVVIPQAAEDKFTPPSQLSQKYIVTPTKLRLVALVALLRSLVAAAAKQGPTARGTKVIVFLSSTDSVDFHWKLLGGVKMGDEPNEPEPDEEEEGAESADEIGEDGVPIKKKMAKKPKSKSAETDLISLTSSLFPKTTLHRLHGSLPLRTRLASLNAFASASAQPSILFATSVASRGLDLPLVRAVVQYDLPTEGGANEYVHRVGRTARAGKGGEAWAFVGPSETEWVPWVEGKMGAAEGKGGVRLGQVGVEDVLRKGFGGKGYEFEGRATDVQLSFERWVLEGDQNAALARKAFSSFIRAYSTHPIEEKKYFHIKTIHLGHLAKSFALREAPGALSVVTKAPKERVTSSATNNKKRKRIAAGSDGEDDEGEEEVTKGGKEATARNETERRMYEAVRKQGRMVRSGGKMGAFAGNNNKPAAANGAGSEFHVFNTGELEKMVAGKRK
ncbi:hypothetical protein CI109_106073 [Kwoniella shandongensis]|uniref:ATP-dependent RNA helicase n=1 Tax=Kwoniella shandongensis TaxID=1734106 RepID=A0A5M6BQY5_9TREE|nr:uncharacterized protein CI109_006389 [Kwoniella shandongensis]KAA5525318.1 hypothetical protein CI109_006389 [Kwoniella shandongensis]